MSKLIITSLTTVLISLSLQSFAKDIHDPVAFIKKMPYQQAVKELALSRCLSQVSDSDKTFSIDAARTANAIRDWIPFDIESGDDKINALIDKFKARTNEFHSESETNSQGVTLNCLRLYHSPELDDLSRTLIVGNPNHSWETDNPHK